jgi:hypothetical protein
LWSWGRWSKSDAGSIRAQRRVLERQAQDARNLDADRHAAGRDREQDGPAPTEQIEHDSGHFARRGHGRPTRACERPLGYRARPTSALDRLREHGPERLRHEVTKPGPGAAGSLLLTCVALIDRIAALVPPPGLHRHRNFGVLAANAPLRTAVTAVALSATISPQPIRNPPPGRPSIAPPARPPCTLGARSPPIATSAASPA